MTQAEAPTAATLEETFVVSSWLNREAELLDDQRMAEWVELLDPDIDYRVPIRITRERESGPGFSEDSYHLFEDHESLATRVERLATDHAWSEDPPSRSRRMIGNVRVSKTAEGFRVKSNLFVFRGRLDHTEYDLISCERQDLLVPDGDGFKLRERLVLLDHSTIPTKNLAIFF